MDAPDELGKRKYKENALTAKAENGTLRVKILRKDQQQQLLLSAGAGGGPGRARPQPRSAAPPSPESPPKPRPNRKHVPIFYQQKRRPRADTGADDAHASSSSVTSSGTNDFSGTGLAASTSSTGSAFAGILSGLQLNSSSSSSVSTSGPGAGSSIADLLPPPPAANPLFSRNDSDGLGALSELLRPHFPSASGPSFPLSGASSGILPQHMLLSAPIPSTSVNGASAAASATSSLSTSAASTDALHQLASSSQHYRSALDALSAATIQSGSLGPAEATPAPPLPADKHSEPETSTTRTYGSSGDSPQQYRFNPLSALQSAIDHAQQLSQTLAGKNPGEPASSSLSPPPASHPPLISDASMQRLLDDTSDEDSGPPVAPPLGPPPASRPALSMQNSLMGGGIEAMMAKQDAPSRDKAKATASTLPMDAAATADGDLGPPPAAPPAFRIENSLMGGGIETQPMIANVNTHNFDWKFRKSAAGLGGSSSSSTAKAVEDGGKHGAGER